jgi:hypothetical protein
MKYKFLLKGMKSNSGNIIWKKGIWKHEDTVDMCNAGFHCSQYPDQAFSFVQGEILALVETKGKSIIQDDKECWSDMRIVKVYKWEKKDSVALAIYAAELVIDIFEKKYPHDDRPRKAIDAAKKWLKKPSADAAYAAHAAAHAAAYAADAAAHAAAHAADAADDKEVLVKKIRLWMLKRVKTLKPYRRNKV